MKQIIIDIRGQAASGKTTIGLLLLKLLQNEGFNAEFDDEDSHYSVGIKKDIIINGLKNTAQIFIKSTQTKRDTK